MTSELEPDDIGPILDAVDEHAPPSGLRATLLSALMAEKRGEWWRGFVRRASAILDLDEAATAAVFAGIADDSRWGDGPLEGISLFHIEGGPAVQDAITGFVRLAPGAAFPHHRHVGDESVIILQGSLYDGAGEGARAARAGEEVTMGGGSSHTITAGDDGCLYLVVSRDGIAFDGEEPIGPDDPRA